MGCTCEKKSAPPLKRHLFPHGDRVKILAQGFLDLFVDAAPHLEYFSNFPSTKVAFAEAAFDTLQICDAKHAFPVCFDCNGQPLHYTIVVPSGQSFQV